MNELTSSNYYDYTIEGALVVSNSILSYINTNEKGSYKRFKRYLDGLSKQVETTYFRRGKSIHKYIEDREKFIVADFERPSDPVVEVMSKLHQLYPDVSDINNLRNEIVEEAKAINYAKGRYTDAVVLERFIRQGEDYFKFLHSSSKSFVLTKSEKESFEGMRLSLENHEISNELIRQDSTSDIEIVKEMPLIMEIDTNVYLKGLLDHVKINHKEKTIDYIDPKSTSKNPHKFYKYSAMGFDEDGQLIEKNLEGSFFLYRYYRQFAVYNMLLKNKYPDYTITSNRVVAIESVDPYEIVVYDVDNDALEFGKKEAHILLNAVIAYAHAEGISEF